MSGRTLRDRASLLLRHASAIAGAATGRLEARLSSLAGRTAILMYHRVLPDAEDASAIEPGMYVRASTFDEQIAWIRRRWSIATLGRALESEPSAPDASRVVLTFDDGWRDNLTEAWPILARHGVRATIFLVRDWVEAGRNAEGAFLAPGEVGDLAREGVEFGAHSASHPALDRLSDEEAEREMRLSREAVADWTGAACTSFAYPYGAHRDSTVELARRLFRWSVIVGGGWCGRGVDPARVPRIGVHQDMASTRWLFESRLARAAA